MTPDLQSRAALLTPAGVGAIAVVRLTGPGAAAFAARHLSRPPIDNHAVHCDLLDDARIIDDIVAVSASGGALLDLNLHGGAWIVEECMALARRSGFIILPGDDPAMLESVDIFEQEMLAALPVARTREALRLLAAQPALWRQWLAKPRDRAAISRVLHDRTLWWMLNPPRVAIIGAPNVGKSTLANALFAEQRSITADLPGTTRDWVGDYANLNGLPIFLLDTPGQRQTIDSIEQAAILQSQREIESADLRIRVIDPDHACGLAPEAPPCGLPGEILVINKCDLPAAAELVIAGAVRIAAKTGAGLDDLQRRIRQCFAPGPAGSSPLHWTRRQRELLEKMSAQPQ